MLMIPLNACRVSFLVKKEDQLHCSSSLAFTSPRGKARRRREEKILEGKGCAKTGRRAELNLQGGQAVLMTASILTCIIIHHLISFFLLLFDQVIQLGQRLLQTYGGSAASLGEFRFTAALAVYQLCHLLDEIACLEAH